MWTLSRSEISSESFNKHDNAARFKVERVCMPASPPTRVVVCGAGLAGIAAARTIGRVVDEVIVVDASPPMSMTSAVSTECYRNVWNDPRMVRLTNASIEEMKRMAKDSDNFFNMTERGYVYFTKDENLGNDFIRLGERAADIGLRGKGRVFSSTSDVDGSERTRVADHDIDIYFGSDVVRKRFPFVSEENVCALHARRCGWVDAQQLGSYMFSEAKTNGVRFVRGRVDRVLAEDGGVVVNVLKNGAQETLTLRASHFVNAAGPWTNDVHCTVTSNDDELPERLSLTNEVHAKVIFHDVKNVIPADAPMVICADELHLPWDDEMREYIESTARDLHKQGRTDESDAMSRYLERLPSGVHFRPSSTEGYVLMLWDFMHENVRVDSSAPNDPSPYFDDLYVEMVLRGLSQSVAPALERYVQSGNFGPKTTVDGGYYCHTPDNMPLIGYVPGTYERVSVLSGLSGFGVMACCGAADLLATIISRSTMHDETRELKEAFSVTRFDHARTKPRANVKSPCPRVSRALSVIGGSI